MRQLGSTKKLCAAMRHVKKTGVAYLKRVYKMAKVKKWTEQEKPMYSNTSPPP